MAATLDDISEQLRDIAGLMRRHLEQNERQTNMLRDEFHANRALGRQIATCLQDLRGELEHQRTQPERDEHRRELARLAADGG